MIRMVGVFCIIVLLSGCSVKFAYNNVDRLVRWQVSDYLDLDAAQKDLLQMHITELMVWHRAEHLSVYADYLKSLSITLSDEVTPEQIASIFDQLLLWGEEVEVKAFPGAIAILRSLSEEQVAALPARFEKSNEEIAEDELDLPLEKVQANWARDFEDVLERFVGRLQREQKDYILRRAGAYQPERVLWAEYRRRWQADLMKLLDRRDQETFAAEFKALSKARDDYYGEVFSKVNAENIQLSREVAAHLLSNLTDRQSERFSESLLELAEDFEELAAQAKVDQAA